MSLDTKYRPLTYDDVLGQENTIQILRRFVATGAGFQQSYLFAGQFGSGKCITGDSLVTTGEGLHPIQNLMGSLDSQTAPVNIKVLQESGKHSLAEFSYRGGVKDVVNITTHLGLHLSGTPNHRIKVMGSDGCVQWRSLAEIQEGDYACVVRGGLFGTGADISGFSHQIKSHEGDGRFQPIPFKTPKKLTPEWGRLIGYLVGDGSSHVIPRAFLAFIGLDYVKAGDKSIPWSIMGSPEPIVREFLRGYFEAAGHVGRGGIEIITKSQILAHQVQITLLNLGVVSRVAPLKKHSKYGCYWRLCVLGNSYGVFRDKVGFVSKRKKSILDSLIGGVFKQGFVRDLSNVRDIIPYQKHKVRDFYRQLPSEKHSKILNYKFQSQYGKVNCSYAVARYIVDNFRDYDDGHFSSVVSSNYYFDYVETKTYGRAEVYDLNVPDGEMFSANGFMNHNTTLGRILARSLLCENPSDTGDACNECRTCKALIETGSCQEFVEVDAATNSGKADIKKITEEIQYMTFSGRHRIYLFDEAHQLSRDALDAMLKPLEENVSGSEDKKLVCIFCTTEPERMRATILSRCAPAFVIHSVTPQDIAGRLEYICQQEGVKYDPEVLVLIAESVECHIRDAIKAIEGVALLGEINQKNVVDYLRLDLNTAYLDILGNLGTDLPAVVDAVKRILERTSPVTCYEKLADVAMMVYHASLGAMKPPSYWDADRIKAIGDQHGPALLSIANCFASRPTRATRAMLFCDVSQIHYGGGAIGQGQVVYLPNPTQTAPVQTSRQVSEKPVLEESTENKEPVKQEIETVGKVTRVLKAPALNGGGVYVDERAVGKRNPEDTVSVSEKSNGVLQTGEFERLLGLRLRELDDAGGHTRRTDMGGCRIDPLGGDKG